MDKHFNKIFWILSFLVFVVICLRAYMIPFSHDEAATFFFYVQSDNYLPYYAHVYTNNHVLNSALANLCYHIAGSHRFVLRIPNILAFVVLCFGVYRHFKYFKSVYPKLILVTFFLLPYYQFTSFQYTLFKRILERRKKPKRKFRCHKNFEKYAIFKKEKRALMKMLIANDTSNEYNVKSYFSASS